MSGAVPGAGALLGAVALGVGAVLLAQVWALATWAADRWIARARLEPSDLVGRGRLGDFHFAVERLGAP